MMIDTSETIVISLPKDELSSSTEECATFDNISSIENLRTPTPKDILQAEKRQENCQILPCPEAFIAVIAKQVSFCISEEKNFLLNTPERLVRGKSNVATLLQSYVISLIKNEVDCCHNGITDTNASMIMGNFLSRIIDIAANIFFSSKREGDLLSFIQIWLSNYHSSFEFYKAHFGYTPTHLPFNINGVCACGNELVNCDFNCKKDRCFYYDKNENKRHETPEECYGCICQNHNVCALCYAFDYAKNVFKNISALFCFARNTKSSKSKSKTAKFPNFMMKSEMCTITCDTCNNRNCVFEMLSKSNTFFEIQNLVDNGYHYCTEPVHKPGDSYDDMKKSKLELESKVNELENRIAYITKQLDKKGDEVEQTLKKLEASRIEEDKSKKEFEGKIFELESHLEKNAQELVRLTQSIDAFELDNRQKDSAIFNLASSFNILSGFISGNCQQPHDTPVSTIDARMTTNDPFLSNVDSSNNDPGSPEDITTPIDDTESFIEDTVLGQGMQQTDEKNNNGKRPYNLTQRKQCSYCRQCGMSEQAASGHNIAKCPLRKKHIAEGTVVAIVPLKKSKKQKQQKQQTPQEPIQQ